MGKIICYRWNRRKWETNTISKLQESLTKDGIDYKVVSFPNYDSPSSSLVKCIYLENLEKMQKEISSYIASTFYAKR